MGTGRWDDDSRWEQRRSPRNRRPDDDMRQMRMSSRGARDNTRGGGGSDGWDRPPHGGGPRYPRRDDPWDDDGRGSSSGRGRVGGSGRGDWDDPRGSRGGPPDRSGDRSMRGGRPPARDDWDAPSSRGRGGPGPGQSSGSSRRPPQGGGLWGDENLGPRGRPGMGGPGGMRDPRAARGGHGFVPEPPKGRLTFGKGAGIVVGMFALGIAAAFGYFLFTRPNPQVDNTPITPASTTAPDTTPTTAPRATPSPSGLVPGGPAYVIVYVGGA